MEGLYSQRDLKKIFPHVPGNTLLWWAREKLLTSTITTKDARGVHRFYSLHDLYRAALTDELLGWGLSPETLRLLFLGKEINWRKDSYLIIDKLSPGRMTAEKGFAFVAYTTQEIKSVNQTALGSCIVDLSNIKRLVDNRIKSL